MFKVKPEKIALIDEIITNLSKELPPVFARRDVPRFLGGSLAVGTLANLGKEKGPAYIRRGKHAIYEKNTFLTWYRSWLAGEAFPEKSNG